MVVVVVVVVVVVLVVVTATVVDVAGIEPACPADAVASAAKPSFTPSGEIIGSGSSFAQLVNITTHKLSSKIRI